ncbi:MAG: nicotinate (nicotinamide) nucleotide adenylyltransferase [Paludibacteraceae bacterium]|nr:nicotinate (nicotinamide) nucleotide adenylyltransferase [Paludibacteraceae bacterium]
MAKIGIYGGSFNPVHFGHIGMAHWVLGHTNLDEIWMMVSPNNPLKDKSILADESIRLKGVKDAIAQLHIADGKRLIASDFEFSLPRPTYTADTLRCLQQTYPQHQFTLLIGEDNWRIFDRWKEYEFILQNFRIFVYPRHDIATVETCPENLPDGFNDRSTISAINPRINVEHFDVKWMESAPYFDISSTQIRASFLSEHPTDNR